MTVSEPSKLYEIGRYLCEVVLEPLVGNRQFRFPPAAPPPIIESDGIKTVFAGLRAEIVDSLDSDLSISTEGKIKASSGWLAQRWCSTYLTIRSFGDTTETPLAVVSASPGAFEWPSDIPHPSVQERGVELTNKVFGYVVLAAFLHEVGHAHYGLTGTSTHAAEYRADEFAFRYLLGSRTDEIRGIIVIGLAVWLCCVCSESLGPGPRQSSTHPNPVGRLRNFLSQNVGLLTEEDRRVWQFSITHIIRLAIVYERAILREEVLLTLKTQNERLLDELKACWEW